MSWLKLISMNSSAEGIGEKEEEEEVDTSNIDWSTSIPLGDAEDMNKSSHSLCVGIFKLPSNLFPCKSRNKSLDAQNKWEGMEPSSPFADKSNRRKPATPSSSAQVTPYRSHIGVVVDQVCFQYLPLVAWNKLHNASSATDAVAVVEEEEAEDSC